MNDQELLIELQQHIAEYVRKHPDLQLASFHVAPDAAWISIEHEEHKVNPLSSNSPTHIIRKSPSCHTIITKL